MSQNLPKIWLNLILLWSFLNLPDTVIWNIYLYLLGGHAVCSSFLTSGGHRHISCCQGNKELKNIKLNCPSKDVRWPWFLLWSFRKERNRWVRRCWFVQPEYISKVNADSFGRGLDRSFLQKCWGELTESHTHAKAALPPPQNLPPLNGTVGTVAFCTQRWTK